MVIRYEFYVDFCTTANSIPIILFFSFVTSILDPIAPRLSVVKNEKRYIRFLNLLSPAYSLNPTNQQAQSKSVSVDDTITGR
jgi:hypothetical protein